jgi:hypothetical protein
MGKNYVKMEVQKSNALGCYVNVFLTVKDLGDKVQLIVTHIPVPQWDRRNYVASDEIIPKADWEKVQKWTLNGMREI